MIKYNIKSLLRNKSNLIYVIIIALCFILLNFALNTEKYINLYYDVIMNKYMEESNSDKDIEYNTRTVSISNSIDTSISKVQEILKNNKYVKRITSIPLTFYLENQENISYDFIQIESIDWKYCKDIIKILDTEGLEATYNLGDNTIYKSYETTLHYSKIIKVFIYFMFAIIINTSCVNIIKNEHNNLKLLKIIGYNQKNIKKIIRIQLTTFIFISMLLGTIITIILICIFSKTIEANKIISLLKDYTIIFIILCAYIIVITKHKLKI